MRMQATVLIAGILAVAVGSAGRALAEDDDHDVARDLYEHREIHALNEILATAKSHVPGDVISVDLVRQNDRWLYLIQIVPPDGHRRTLKVDAGDEEIISDDGARP